MTAIVALVGREERDVESLGRTALRHMHPRGSQCLELWSEQGVTLGAVSDEWEVGAASRGGSGASACLAVEDAAVVVTDASLYYLGDLTAALRAAGVTTATASPAALILAAYQAWGPESFLHHLEGDFAFALWDRRARRLVAGRDPAGSRPLFYYEHRSSIALASRLDGLTTLPGFDKTLNLLAIADDALFLRVNNPQATAYSAISRLPAGHRLHWSAGTPLLVDRWWEVPLFMRGDGPPFPEAVEELRRLIVAAVAERAQHPGGSAIWLSGGYDSSVLFAASQIAKREQGAPAAQPISMSHPPGDPGREDELIAESTSFWGVDPIWVRPTDVPPMKDPVAAARLRDEPLYHTYEQSNRTLGSATRAAGFRAVIVGNGGDQFFSAGVSRLADHFRAGRLGTLLREWREAGGGNNWRLFVRTVVVPNLPNHAHVVARALRHGRSLQHPHMRRLPDWTALSFDGLSELQHLNRLGLKRRHNEGHAALEQSWFLRHVTGERINTAYTATGLLDGVELRSPLFDSRIVHFASGRPLCESYSRQENKRLLRATMRGDLPDSLLGPRTQRTGLPGTFLVTAAREHAEWCSAECGKGMILADLGVIDGRKFLERAGKWLRGGATDVEEAATLVAATQVECWLRARAGYEY